LGGCQLWWVRTVGSGFQLIRTELELDLDFIILRTRPGTVISELKLKYMPLKK
jgi:hypothetical protein